MVQSENEVPGLKQRSEFTTLVRVIKSDSGKWKLSAYSAAVFMTESVSVNVSVRRVFDAFVLPPSVHPQRPGSQKRPCDGGQRYEDRRLRSRQRRAQYRLLQKDHERESPSIVMSSVGLSF